MDKRIEKIEEQITQIKQKLSDSHLCEGSASTYSRITGYYRPVNAWNTGKKQEMTQRLEYSTELLSVI
jgi:anaerobic ribonucleoside-triphosphate reductase